MSTASKTGAPVKSQLCSGQPSACSQCRSLPRHRLLPKPAWLQKRLDPWPLHALRAAGRRFTREEVDVFLLELSELLESPARMLDVPWEVGDFALVDNLAVGHYASQGLPWHSCRTCRALPCTARLSAARTWLDRAGGWVGLLCPAPHVAASLFKRASTWLVQGRRTIPATLGCEYCTARLSRAQSSRQSDAEIKS